LNRGKDVHNALARSKRDFMLEGDMPQAGSRVLAYLDLVLRRPIEVAGVLAISGFTVAILVNALAMQNGAHPSPFFPRASLVGADPDGRQRGSRDGSRAGDATASVTPEPSPLMRNLQAALGARGLYEGVPDGLFGPRTEAAIRAFQENSSLIVDGRASEALLARIKAAPPVARIAAQPGDPIAGLIRGTGVPPSPPNKRLMVVEQALASLGYGPIKIDGLMDEATRDAIERFERDRSLQETGAMSPRLVRELAAVSGLPLE
jgi:peptidoglycan hydrolase-like protein with peptidoglycan-binding domain